MSIAGGAKKLFSDLDVGGIFATPKPAELPAWQTEFGKAQAAIAAQQAANADSAADAYHTANPLMGATADPNSNAINVGTPRSATGKKVAGALGVGPQGVVANSQAFLGGQVAQHVGVDARASLADAAAAGRAINLSDAASAAGQTTDTAALRQAAAGLGPSAAVNLAQDQLQRNTAAQASLAATARGGNVAAAMRTAANSGTQQALQSQSQVAALRAQEQATARGQLVTADQGARQQDQQRAVAAAGAASTVGGQQVGLANTNAGLATAGLSGLAGAANTYQHGVDTQSSLAQAQSASDQAYLDYLQRMYATSSGIPTGYAGVQGSIGLGNAQAQQQNQAAKTSAVGGLIGAII